MAGGGIMRALITSSDPWSQSLQLADGIPYTLGPYVGHDKPGLREQVQTAKHLPFGAVVLREYRNAAGKGAELYAIGVPVDLDACLPLNGWTVTDDQQKTVAGSEGLRVREFLATSPEPQEMNLACLSYWRHGSAGVSEVVLPDLKTKFSLLFDRAGPYVAIQACAETSDGYAAQAFSEVLEPFVVFVDPYLKALTSPRANLKVSASAPPKED
jgi:hypothetical protein